MGWRCSQSDSRQRLMAQYDASEVERYESWVRELGADEDKACLADLAPEFQFHSGMAILDIGAGTGEMCKIMRQIDGLNLTALEPCAPMRAKLIAKPELNNISVVDGFSDSADDRSLFAESSFDVIVSRQLVNGLFDPLTAFQNWHHWLVAGGTIVVIDGLYNRQAWAGPMQQEVDSLPMSACQTMAMTPYLLESVGFKIGTVRQMAATNALPTTRTKRYVVIAHKQL